VTRLELLRVPREAPPARGERLVRAGARAAAMGVNVVATAGRLQRLRAAALEDDARERALVLRDASRRALRLHGIDLDAGGPLPLGPALLASNHVSWLDPLVVASVLPCVPISKLDVSGWPVIGTLARDLGVLFVSRGDPRSGARVLRGAGEALAKGLPVLNFPEGTTTTGATVLPFRKGLFGVARARGAPVVPVAVAFDPPDLAWVGDDRFLPHWLKLASSRRACARIRFGRAIAATDHPDAAALARAARDAVARLLEEIR
jgi:1-acyl-sn-glycerol-3-phosphate acyltransferase